MSGLRIAPNRSMLSKGHGKSFWRAGAPSFSLPGTTAFNYSRKP